MVRTENGRGGERKRRDDSGTPVEREQEREQSGDGDGDVEINDRKNNCEDGRKGIIEYSSGKEKRNVY